MANPKYFENEDTDPIGALYQQNAILARRIADLEREHRNNYAVTALPRIDPVTYPNPYEGQRAIDEADEQHTWYSNGVWRKAAPGGAAIYEIKVFEDTVPLVVGDGAFIWEVPEDLDGAEIIKAAGFVSTVGGSTTQVQMHFVGGADILSTKITIEASETSSKTAATQPVVSGGAVTVAWGDLISIDVDAAGSSSMGLGIHIFVAPNATGSVVIQGAQGPPGGVTSWTGQWSSSTTYVTNQAVSNNGSSYVAIAGSTNVQPGVTAGWQTYWMQLAGNQQFTVVTAEISSQSYVITSGLKAIFDVPFAATIVACRVLADQVGSIVFSLKKSTYAGYPGSLTSIVASAPPTLSSVSKSEDTALTGWTTSITAGDIFQLAVTGTPLNVTWVAVSLKLQRI